MRWGLRTGPAMSLGCLLAATVLTGCGSRAGAGAGTGGRGGAAVGAHAPVGASAALQPVPVLSGDRLSKHAPGVLERRALPAVGTPQRVDAGGAELDVTVARVIDPLRHSGVQLPRGARAVGVIVRIRSFGPKLYDSSATGDISLLSSAGVATPVLATRGICRTAQNDFDRYITSGEHRSGCVVFAVSDGATLDAVRFSPHAHQLGRLTWAP